MNGWIGRRSQRVQINGEWLNWLRGELDLYDTEQDNWVKRTIGSNGALVGYIIEDVLRM